MRSAQGFSARDDLHDDTEPLTSLANAIGYQRSFQTLYRGGQVPWPPGYFACMTRSISNLNSPSSSVDVIPLAF